MPLPNANSSWEPVFAKLALVRGSWPMRGWSWDGRFSCVSSSFTVDVEEKARTAVKQAFTESWTHDTLGRAPPRVRAVTTKAGGIRAGQLVLACAESEHALAFGLWWPWGDGVTISLRVGLADVDESTELHAKFRGIFGVSL